MKSVVLYVALLCALSSNLVNCEDNVENGLHRQNETGTAYDHAGTPSSNRNQVEDVSFTNSWMLHVEEMLSQIIMMIKMLSSKIDESTDPGNENTDETTIDPETSPDPGNENTDEATTDLTMPEEVPKIDTCNIQVVLISFTVISPFETGVNIYLAGEGNNYRPMGQVLTAGKTSYFIADGGTRHIYTLEFRKPHYNISTYTRIQPFQCTTWRFTNTGSYELPALPAAYTSIALDPLEKYLLIASGGGASLLVLEVTSDGQLSAGFDSAEVSGEYVAVSPKRDDVFAVTSSTSLKVVVFRVDIVQKTLTIIQKMTAPEEPSQPLFSSNGKLLYVVSKNAEIYVYDVHPDIQSRETPLKQRIVDKATANGRLYYNKILIDSSNNFLYLLDRPRSSIKVFSIDPSDGKILQPPIKTDVRDPNLRNFAMRSDGKQLIVTHPLDKTIMTFTVGANGRLGNLKGITTNEQLPQVIFVPIQKKH